LFTRTGDGGIPAPVIRAQHERGSGQGYPDGLTGDEIPLPSRIIAVADMYDAMTSDRPYRASLSREAAMAEVPRVSGVELDPACVAAFVACFEDGSAPALPEAA